MPCGKVVSVLFDEAFHLFFTPEESRKNLLNGNDTSGMDSVGTGWSAGSYYYQCGKAKYAQTVDVGCGARSLFGFVRLSC